MNRKSTGPRTPTGKARSAQNATKHRIFTQELSSEERQEFATLRKGIQEELRLSGPVELEVGEGIARNRLQGLRIDEWAEHQFDLAEIQGRIDQDDRRDQYFIQRHLPNEAPSETAERPARRHTHPQICVMLLELLQADVKDRGPNPEEDIGLVTGIYGGHLTETASYVIFIYRMLQAAREIRRTTGAADIDPQTSGHQAWILKAIEIAILEQRCRMTLEKDKVDCDFGPDVPALPPDDIVDKIARYRTANDRELIRKLKILSMLRTLKSGS
jgi:hypothetical protein